MRLLAFGAIRALSLWKQLPSRAITIRNLQRDPCFQRYQFQIRHSHIEATQEDSLWREVKDLHVRAYKNDAAAQYQLGLMYLEESNPEDENEDWTLDAEAQRQKVNESSSGLTDIKSIRKHARKLYKEYLMSRAQKVQPTGAMGLVQRTTRETLDAVFGDVVQPLLDGSKKIHPLSKEFQLPNESMELMRESNSKAIEWIRRAAENGYPDANVRLGNLCMEHDPPLIHAAIAWYSAIAKSAKPHPDALYNLGMIFYEDHSTSVPPLAQDLPLSMSYFMRAALIGDPSAQYFMGYVLHVGNEVVPANPIISLNLLEQAASQGHGGALYYMAQLYLNGDGDLGIKKDGEKFLSYLQAAVDGDFDEALVCLADLYREGFPPLVDVNVQEAHNLYERAANQGNAEALCTLGALAYSNNMYEQAFQYYQAAADRHSMSAWKNLADMYYSGHGVPQNKKTAESILSMLRKLDDPQ